MAVGNVVLGGVVVLVGLALLWRGTSYYRLGKLVLDMPTENIRSASLGRTELEGRVEPAEYVVDRPFSEGQCLYADYRIRQRVDDNRNRWKAYATIFEHTVAVPFHLNDGTGRVRVDVDGNTRFSISAANSRTHGSKNAYITEFLRENTGLTGKVQDVLGGVEFDHEAVASTRRRELQRLEEQYGSFEHVPRPALNDSDILSAESGWSRPTLKGTARWLWRVVMFTPKRSGDISDTTTHRQFIETCLPVGESVYVFGTAESPPADTDVDLVLTEDPSTNELLISDRPEEATARSFRRWSALCLAGGLPAAAYGVWLLLGGI